MINSEIHIYIYLDKQCITENKDVGTVVLLRKVLWTSLAGLHDCESRSLPPIDSMPNR